MKTFSKTITTAQVVWMPALNYRHDYGNVDGLVRSFQLRGWNPSEPADVEPVGNHSEAVMEYLQQKYSALTERVENPTAGESDYMIVDPSDDLETEGLGTQVRREPAEYHAAALKAFKLMHCNDKGKLLKPKYVGITGNRRSVALAKAITNQILLGYKPSLDVHVVTSEEPYSDAERVRMQVGENNQQGRKPTNLQEDLVVARRLVEEFGTNQSALRKLYSAAKGVQLYYLTVICIYEERAKFGLGLWDKLTDPIKDKDGKISYEINAKKFNHTLLQGTKSEDFPFIGPRCDLEPAYAKRLAKAEKKGEDFIRTSKDDLELFINSVAKGAKINKGMSMTAIKDIGAGHKCEAVRLFTEVIVKNDKSNLTRLYERAEGLNRVLNMSDEDFAEFVK